jgi:hypothetical protein
MSGKTQVLGKANEMARALIDIKAYEEAQELDNAITQAGKQIGGEVLGKALKFRKNKLEKQALNLKQRADNIDEIIEEFA